MRRLLGLTLLLLCVGSAQGRVRRKVVHKKKPTPVTFDVNAANDPNLKTEVGPRSSGSATLRAQILLDRAHFSVGQIDGSYGDNMRTAVKAYQSAHELPADGVVNSQTWDALDSDTGPVLAPYTI